MKRYNKAISPVIAVILVLSITVILSLGVFLFLNVYSQDQLDETQNNQILDDFDIRVVDINSEQILVQTASPTLNVTRVLLDGVECLDNTGLINARPLRINVSSCSDQITTQRPRLIIETDDGIIQRDLNSRDLGVTPITSTSSEASSLGSGPCFESTNVGTIGSEGPCNGFLIVDRTLLLDLLSDSSTYSDAANAFTGQITDMSGTAVGGFIPANFNEDISGWDVSNVVNMRFMFWDSNTYGSLSLAGVSSLFVAAGPNFAFNQDISSWDVSNVVDMTGMFYGADDFNQDLSGWDVSSVTQCTDFDTNSGLNIGNRPNFASCSID